MKLNGHAVFAWIVIPAVTWGSILWLSFQAPQSQAPQRVQGGHGVQLPGVTRTVWNRPAPHGNLAPANHD